MKVYEVKVKQVARAGYLIGEWEFDIAAPNAQAAMQKAQRLTSDQEFYQKSRPVEILSLTQTVANLQ